MASNEPLPLTEFVTEKDIGNDGIPTAKLPLDGVLKDEYYPQLILGVEYEILIKFLKLFRDHYRKCEKATTFLEHRTDIPNFASIANQRDAISHFKSALQEGVTYERRLYQYAQAEEHFRRAIIEPYETALIKKVDDLIKVLEPYTEKVLPVKDRYDELKGFPDSAKVDSTVHEIAKLRDKARQAKGKNIWDEEWENGVEAYVTGFDLAHDLLRTIQNAVFTFQQIERDEAKNSEIESLKKQLEDKHKELESLRIERSNE